jgi:hypothetical protein
MEQLTARNIVAAVTALAIIIVVGLGFVIRGGVNAQAQANDLVTIAQGLQAEYANQSYVYPVILPSAVLINSGKVDPTIVNGTAIDSRWQTAITLAGVAAGGFTTALTAIPYNACTELLTDQSLSQYATSFIVDSGTAAPVPITPSVAATACTATGTHSITIAFAGHP